MAVTPENLGYLLKTFYKGQDLRDLAIVKHPLLDIVKKRTDMAGDKFPFPFTYGTGTNNSHDFEKAQANTNNAEGGKFELDSGELYAFVTFNDKSLEKARSEPGAFANHMKLEVERQVKGLGKTLSNELFGSGGGALGTISSNPTNTASQTLTLTNAGDIGKFGKGAILVASANDGSLASHALRVGRAQVASVDKTAGTMVITQLTDVSAWAPGDSLFIEGSFGGGSSAANAKIMKGLRAWVPTSVASDDSFFGFNRSVDSSTRGYYYSAAEGGSEIDRVQAAATLVNERHGGTPNLLVVPWANFLAMTKELQNQGPTRSFDRKGTTGHVGYETLKITVGYGTIDVLADADCRAGDGWLLNEDHMCLLSMGDLIKVMNRDGRDVRALTTSPGWEMRWVSYPCFAMDATNEHGRIAMPTY